MAGKRKAKADRQAWWASLTADEQSAYIDRAKQRKVANPSRETREACARLDLATERGCFMTEVPDEDVIARLAKTTTVRSA